MKWSWKVSTFKGIDVFIHATFLLIIGWVGLSSWLQTRTFAGTLEGVLFILMLFGFVVFHEFGHALTARRYGIKTRDITLYPIGGVARLERMPEQPIQEFWVALAGPAVNVAIAALLFGWLMISNSLAPLSNLSLTTGSFIERLMVVNISLALFNLIPAFPMDGGRVLRSLLALRFEYPRATQIAATIGKGLAVVLGIVGLSGNPFLVFIALFVWMGAGQENTAVKLKAALTGIPVRRATLTNIQVLSPSDRVENAVELMLAGSQTDFPVLENDILVGMARRNDLLGALARRENTALISSIMRRELQAVDDQEMLENAFLHFQECECSSLPVTQNGIFAGLLTIENIGELLRINSSISRNRGQEVSIGL